MTKGFAAIGLENPKNSINVRLPAGNRRGAVSDLGGRGSDWRCGRVDLVTG